MRRSLILFVLLLLLGPGRESARVEGQLQPTLHAPVPQRASDLWLVPSSGDPEARTVAAHRPLIDGVARYQTGDYAGALPLVSQPPLAATPLADYAAYYRGLSQLRLAQFADARRTLDALAAKQPTGHLAVAAAIGAAEAAGAEGDHASAIRTYERLTREKGVAGEDVWSRLGHAALAAGDRKKAAEAFLHVYYQFPLTEGATTAGSHLAALSDLIDRRNYKLDIGRAQQLFAAQRYAEAQAAFQDLQKSVDGDDRELADLRVAESHFYLKRYAAARDALRPYLDRASRKAEARFFYLSAWRELGDHDQFVTLSRALVQEFPDSSWAEETINNLARHYVLIDDDQQAAQVYRELYQKFPRGQRAERAAWKWGWWAYKTGDFAEAARVFEDAAAGFPRSDYRPSYLYWAARCHERLGEAAQAGARLRLVYTDYANSYYGRLAERTLIRRAGGLQGSGDVVPASYTQPTQRQSVPNEQRIRLLLANGLYDDALNELRYAQRLWGTSPAIDATIAWAYHQKGELRRAITLMRRTYPQHLTAAQPLPPELLKVIFPLTYWDLIRKYSAQRNLDPYIVAALIAQESTFEPDARSVANAYGLMQVVPATGRRLARSAGMRTFSTAMLTNPEVNIRLGTLHFSRLVEQFGGTHFALASYNAGENRIVRWKAERPGIDTEEWIDDIPFPETQNYVKRILGTAEDYRDLYGSGLVQPKPVMAATPTVNPARALPPPASAKSPAARKRPAGKSTAKRPSAKKPSAKRPSAKRPPAKKPPVRKSPSRRGR